MSPSSASPVKTILAVILILALVIGIWSAIHWFNQSMANALNPLQQANNQLSTQVAELLHPTPTVIPDPVTIIREVNALARLETIQYTIEKIVTVEQGQDALAPLFGDRLLFVAHGYVTAGIDMAKLSEADLWMDGDVLNVRLPAAEVFDATLDNEQSYVYDRETGLLTHGNPNLETLARQAAEQQILQAALESGILEQARVNAELFLDRFFEALGYERVVFLP